MINYNIDQTNIESAVDALSPKWRTKAKTRTKKLKKDKAFTERSSIWSEVKPVFIKAQSQKCAFCERQFESAEYGRIEYDLEHFRPKSSVKAWQPPGNASYDCELGEASPKGYYWLAYELRNYLASCKVCNTPLKSNYFPIAARRITIGKKFDELTKERPFLCYPIGRCDDDPETLVNFIGTIAVPAASSGHNKTRGQIIIDFFRLNDREQLHRERARMIAIYGSALSAIEAGINVVMNQQVANSLLGNHIPHANCLRSFARAWSKDRFHAQKTYIECSALAFSMEVQ